MKVLVTGGAGYIGDAAVDYLLGAGHTVTVFDNLMYGHSYMRRHINLSFVRGDISDISKIQSLIYNHDSVLHLAAIVGDPACAANPELTIRVNQQATEDIAEICKALDKRIVFASTCSVYGANNNPLDEDSPTNPLSLYAGTKLKAEDAIRRVPKHYICRLGTLFGLSTEHARLRCDLVANILTYKASLGERLTVYGGEQYRPLLHVRDAGELMAIMASRPDANCENVSRGGYGTYILSDSNHTILQLAKNIITICGLSSHMLDVTEIPFEDQRNYRVSASRRGSFWIPRFSLFDGIEEMHNVIREGRIANVWDTQHHNGKYIKEVFNA